MPPLTFDSRNREARFVAPWFAERSEAAVRVSWKIRHGNTIRPGDAVGELTWGDGSTLALTAPAGCQGVVEAANRRIHYANLDKRPAEWAIRMEP